MRLQDVFEWREANEQPVQLLGSANRPATTIVKCPQGLPGQVSDDEWRLTYNRDPFLRM